MRTGCRKNEIMTLRRERVGLDKAEMRIANRNTGSRTVHLSPSAVRVLEALPRELGNLWGVPGTKLETHMADIEGGWQTIRARRFHPLRTRFPCRQDAQRSSELLVSGCAKPQTNGEQRSPLPEITGAGCNSER